MARSDERRKFARLNILVDVSYTKHDTAEKQKLSVTKNISQGGICFVGYELVHEQDIIDLNVYLPGGSKEPVEAMGKVVWVKEFTIGDNPKNKRYDVGVEFTEISDQDSEKIETYMQEHSG